MMRIRRFPVFPCFLVVLLTWALSAPVSAATSAYTVTSGAQLLSGIQADGQIGDLVLENDHIVVVISALGHITHYGENGGTVIDAGLVPDRSDALGELYTYFDDDWPRQAYYTSLTIVNDGSGGGPAIVRASGHDVYDPGLTVVTEYSLADGNRYLTLATWVTGSGPVLYDFELGDAFQWGSCDRYAPGYGFAVSGTTTQTWMAGLASDVCYGYAGTHGDCWGPSSNGWSDLNVRTADIGPGFSVGYIRFLAVSGAEIAAAASILMEALGLPSGTVTCDITSMADGSPLAGALVDVFDGSGYPHLQMVADATGQAQSSLPPGIWRLQAGLSGFQPEERWLTVVENGAHHLDFPLSPVSSGGEAIGDTLTIIQRPLVNIPAFVLPGQTLAIHCAADPLTTGWQAELSLGAITLPLSITGADYDPGTEWWTLDATVPAPTLYDLYDLRVTADGGLDDTTRHSVQVLPQFKDDYYFIHITDTHLPDHEFSADGSAPEDSTETVDLRTVIQDINLINPEFVLITGDFINEGELEDYLNWRSYTRAQRQLYEFRSPTFLVSGNHDIGGWSATPPTDGTARREWWRFFGWPRLDDPPAGAPQRTQNFSFDYGPVHFVGLESYNNYDLWREEIYGTDSFLTTQLTWLSQDLAGATASQTQVLFFHKDFQGQLNLDALGVEMALWGHIHSDKGDLQVQPYDLATNSVCDGKRNYRLIRVSNGTLEPEATMSAGDFGENLTVNYSPANTGISHTVTAQIINNQPQRFEHGRLLFVMPAASGYYTATGGQVLQVDQSGPYDVCHVAVDIQATGSQSVTVSPMVTDVPEPGDGFVLRLNQNHPNPFNPATELSYQVPRDGPARLDVFDLQGRQVAVLVDEILSAGNHTASWNGRDDHGRDVPSGVYLVRLAIPDLETSRKIMLAR